MHDPSIPAASASVTRRLDGEADTIALGNTIGRALAPAMVIYLRGELGAGKTTLARGVLRALGYTGKVKSPTYTLVELYNLSKLYLYHFDFYRLEDPHGWIDAGFREYFTNESVCLVEWPEKASGSLPPADLEVRLEIEGAGRIATLIANTDAGRRCLSALSA